MMSLPTGINVRGGHIVWAFGAKFFGADAKEKLDSNDVSIQLRLGQIPITGGSEAKTLTSDKVSSQNWKSYLH